LLSPHGISGYSPDVVKIIHRDCNTTACVSGFTYFFLISWKMYDVLWNKKEEGRGKREEFLAKA
jgi:hypothetical protein